MNYYIQGDAAKADQIKAAFEKLGISIGGYDFICKDALYFTYEAKGETYMMSTLLDTGLDHIIKTHPDYKELELPVQANFKVGDWVAGIDDEGDMATEMIVSFSHNKVLLVDTDGCHTEYPKTELNGFHRWTIADAKDGDVLVCYSEVKGNPIEQAGIFKQYVGQHGGCSNTFLAHTRIDWDGNIIINGYMGSTNILPATKEQRDLLFARIREAGYEWDAEKKELRKIKPHYDIVNFQPFDKVLGRDYDEGVWICDLYSYYYKGDNKMGVDNAFVCVGDSHLQCIPYEGNEHLLGTTDPCGEEYINW